MSRLRKQNVFAAMLVCVAVGCDAMAMAEVKKNAATSAVKKPVTQSMIAFQEAAPEQQKQKPQETSAKKPTVNAISKKIAPAEQKKAKGVKPVFYPALTAREQTFEVALKMNTDAEFVETPLEDVVTYFSERHKVPIVIQAKDLENNLGITADEPIDAIFAEISLSDALLQILDPLDLTFIVDRGLIQVLSKESASETFKTRVYPVGDLCIIDEDYLVLGTSIQNANLGSWKSIRINTTLSNSNPKQGQKGHAGSGFFSVQGASGGGLGGGGGFGGGFGGGGSQAVYADEPGGTISVVQQSHALVISQTYHAHNAIVELLTQLRQAQQDNE
ncbi:hypothetical protein [Gimesia algae]|uniref:Curli production assembly/transport component CsgG n=1 Tax=Gimesia algae TaxID=2527971 RepID=A0A517VE19_9PLAN|nr:hypothetical protein [Gimesia algae]QDT91253.1 hypothetical protein Pan161_29090 [Gimesia algae]